MNLPQPVQKQILGLLRHVLSTVGGYVLAQGWVADAELQTIIGGLLALAAAVLSWWDKRAPAGG